jgi:sentrin-specific protease 1
MRPLTPEEMKRVTACLANAAGLDPLAPVSTLAASSLLLTAVPFASKDARLCRDGAWLNDEVLNYFNACLARSTQDAAGRCPTYIANTFFWAKLCEGGYAAVARWTGGRGRKLPVDIFSMRRFLVPVNRGNVHWALALVDVPARTICYLDSLGGDGADVVEGLRKYLEDEHVAKKGVPLPGEPFSGVPAPHDLPRQRNGVDCGAFVCAFIECLARGIMPSSELFTQADLGYWRRRILTTCLVGAALD